MVVEQAGSGVSLPGFEAPATSRQCGIGQVTYITPTVDSSVKWQSYRARVRTE